MRLAGEPDEPANVEEVRSVREGSLPLWAAQGLLQAVGVVEAENSQAVERGLAVRIGNAVVLSVLPQARNLGRNGRSVVAGGTVRPRPEASTSAAALGASSGKRRKRRPS